MKAYASSSPAHPNLNRSHKIIIILLPCICTALQRLRPSPSGCAAQCPGASPVGFDSPCRPSPCPRSWEGQAGCPCKRAPLKGMLTPGLSFIFNTEQGCGGAARGRSLTKRVPMALSARVRNHRASHHFPQHGLDLPVLGQRFPWLRRKLPHLPD